MCEILFRGQCVETGDWIKGFYVRLRDSKGHESHRIYSGYAETDCGDYYPDWWEVDPATVGQFTGLTDWCGEKIFEGDIVRGLFLFGLEILSVVAFRSGSFGLLWKRGTVEEFSPFTSLCNIEYKKIGNIHDNPDIDTISALFRHLKGGE